MTGWLWANEPDGALPASWYAETAPPRTPTRPLTRDLRCETCVIGGGITGLSAALHLAEAGRDVVLLEASQAGFGASGRNGGQVGSGLNWSHERLAARLGAAEARALWRLTEEAKALTRRLVAEHAPAADWQDGVIHVQRAEADAAAARAEADRLVAATGYRRLTTLDRESLSAITGSTAHAGGVLDMGAGRIQPLAYVRGLARAAVRAGVRMHEGTPVRRLGTGATFVVETATGAGAGGTGAKVRAENVVLACNGYVDGLAPRVADHVLPINNYIAVTEPLGSRAPMTAAHAVADDRFVVNYWWQSADGRLVYGGGESYGKRFPRDIAGRVRRNLARVYPDLAGVRFTHAWGGTLAVTATRLPFAAELAPGLLTVAGFSGHGLALSALAGRAMARRIMGDGADFDRLAHLPAPRLPGGRWLGPALTGAALLTLSLRDRLGL